MAWHFYQGLRDEWRWYQVDSLGHVTNQGDRAFSELRACMANAETWGFRAQPYHVHTRRAVSLDSTRRATAAVSRSQNLRVTIRG